MQRYLLLSFLLTAALAGCGRDSSVGESSSTPLPPDLHGVYTGTFPCSNCKAIAATLWVRADERFFLRQSYVGDGDVRQDSTYSFGRWSWDEHEAELVLRGHGPDRHFKRLDADRLELRTDSRAKYAFTRDPSTPPFTDRVRFDGESTIAERSATFTQCGTGLAMPIANEGAFKELRRQQRTLNPSHKIALTAVDAHIVTIASGAATSERLVIDKVIGLKPGTGCEQTERVVASAR